MAETIRRMGRAGFEGALHGFLRRAVAPDNLIVVAYRGAGAPQVLFTHSDRPTVYAHLDSIYLRGAYLLDPCRDLHLSCAPAGAYRLTDIAPDAFQRSRYFLDYYRQTTLVDEIVFLAYPAPGVALNLCIGRDATSGQPFTAREVETCQRLAPIIAAMAETHWAGLAADAGPAPDVAEDLITALAAQGLHLSPRQAEVALLILRGHSTASIGLRLGVSAQTVKVFRKQLYARCGISSQAELFALMLPLLR